MHSSFTSLPAQKPWINYLKYSNSKDNQIDLPDPGWFTIQAAYALSNPRENYWQEGNYLSQHNSGCMCVDWILHSNTSRDTWNFLRYHWICIFQQQQCKDIIYQANPTFGTRQGFWKQIRPLFVVYRYVAAAAVQKCLRYIYMTEADVVGMSFILKAIWLFFSACSSCCKGKPILRDFFVSQILNYLRGVCFVSMGEIYLMRC